MVSNTNDNIGMDVQTKVVTRKKEKNYTPEEDVFLCRAWMAISKDPEEVRDRSSVSLWERIGEKYTSSIENNYVIRPKNSMLNRWSKIRGAVSMFCAIYRSIDDQNLSSYTEKKMIKRALLAYKQERKEKFKFLHCWSELRNSLKWNSEGDLKAHGRLVAQQSSVNDHLNFDADNDFTMPNNMLEQLDRQKYVKQCEGKDVDSMVCSPCTEPTPLSSVSPVFICSSGVINYDLQDHTDMDVQTEGREQAKTKMKGSNYSQEEDMSLCRAWMSIVKAKDESSMEVWNRIVEKYVSLVGSNYEPRTEKSLTQRWHTIRPAVLKFSVIYAIVTDQNPTGYTDKDKINKARVTYKKGRKGKFRFHHCWTILRHSPKWKEVVSRGRLRIGAMYSQEPITNDDSNFDDGYDSPMTIDTSSEELDGNLPEEREVGCREGESVTAAASSLVSALCVPVMPTRDMDSNLHNHVSTNVQTDVSTNVQTDVSEKVNTRKRETNYSEEEDIFLCRAWMAIDADPVMRKDQSFFFWKVETYQCPMTLWERVGEGYASLIGNKYVHRTEHSLTNRWSRIRNAVAKFYSIYKNISEQNFGNSEQEKIKLAVLIFQKEFNERFLFLSCWNELKHSQKWKFETISGVTFRQRHTAMLSQQSSDGEHFSHSDNDDFQMFTPTLFDQSEEQKQVAQVKNCQDVDTISYDGYELFPQTDNLARELFADQPEVENLAMQEKKVQEGDTNLARESLVQNVQVSNGEHFSHIDDDDFQMPTLTLFDQSLGQKPVAQERKGQDADTSFPDGEELFPQSHDVVREISADQPEVEKLAVRKRKIQDNDTSLVKEMLMQKVKKLDELLEIEREKRDIKIMLIDPTAFSDGRRQYFEKLQQKILDKERGMAPSSNLS